MARHENWCEVNQGGGPCDCGASKAEPGETRQEAIRRATVSHATWCDYPSGPCDCGAHPGSC